MNYLADLLKNLNIILASLVAIGSVIGSTYTIYRNKADRKGINKKLSEIDANQNERLDAFEIKIIEIAAKIDSLTKIHTEENYVEKLKSEIIGICEDIVLQHDNLDNAFRSMLIEGTNCAASFFERIKYDGYENINIEILKHRAITCFRGMRSQYNGNVNVSESLTETIKTEIAYPEIEKMLTSLVMLRKGVFNGSSDKEFKKIAIEFVRNIIEKSIINYEKINNKRNNI